MIDIDLEIKTGPSSVAYQLVWPSAGHFLGLGSFLGLQWYLQSLGYGAVGTLNAVLYGKYLFKRKTL